MSAARPFILHLTRRLSRGAKAKINDAASQLSVLATWRARRRRRTPREAVEAAGFPAHRRRGGCYVGVGIHTSTRGLRSSVLARSAHNLGLVAHARRDPFATHTHHHATRGDITTRSAAAPYSVKHAPPLENLCLCVSLWPSEIWFCFLIRFFARALTRRGERRARSRVVAKKTITKKGRCFVLNQADGALSQFPRSSW